MAETIHSSISTNSIDARVSAAIVLPTPSMQNQIHELAKTLPPPRKQNIACDACRCAHLVLIGVALNADRTAGHGK